MIELSTLPGSWLPLAGLNLRRNPFGELTPAERAELAVVDVDAIVDFFVPGTRRAVQLVGQCGRGKTTRMLALAHRIPDSAYVYLPEDGPCGAIAAGNPILIDEAQRLPRAACAKVFAAGLPVVLATHRDMSRRLRRFGYQVSTELIGETNTPELICRLLNRRIESSRLGEGPLPRISLEDARWLSKKFGTNIRAVEGYLYERVQNQAAHYGEMRFVD